MDPDLPFYSHTSHSRLYEDNMPNFNQRLTTVKQPQGPPRRELLGSNVGRRVSFARRGARSFRATFHNHGVDFPPTSTDDVLYEHGYA